MSKGGGQLRNVRFSGLGSHARFDSLPPPPSRSSEAVHTIPMHACNGPYPLETAVHRSAAGRVMETLRLVRHFGEDNIFFFFFLGGEGRSVSSGQPQALNSFLTFLRPCADALAPITW